MSLRRPVVGLITIGQSPRVDVVPDMAKVIGPGVEIREAGALDGLDRAQIDALAPGAGDEILVTRPCDGPYGVPPASRRRRSAPDGRARAPRESPRGARHRGSLGRLSRK